MLDDFPLTTKCYGTAATASQEARRYHPRSTIGLATEQGEEVVEANQARPQRGRHRQQEDLRKRSHAGTPLFTHKPHATRRPDRPHPITTPAGVANPQVGRPTTPAPEVSILAPVASLTEPAAGAPASGEATSPVTVFSSPPVMSPNDPFSVNKRVWERQVAQLIDGGGRSATTRSGRARADSAALAGTPDLCRLRLCYLTRSRVGCRVELSREVHCFDASWWRRRWHWRRRFW